jgi:hypothetical protein
MSVIKVRDLHVAGGTGKKAKKRRSGVGDWMPSQCIPIQSLPALNFSCDMGNRVFGISKYSII